MKNKYAIKLFGEIKYYLNSDLIFRKNLDKTAIKRLILLHEYKVTILALMELEDSIEQLREWSEIIENIEFELQRVWGFPQNKYFHRFWEVPKCSCPNLDNEDRLGTPYRIIDDACKIHGTDF